MRRYDEEVEVRRGWADGPIGAGRSGQPGQPGLESDAPCQFLWRGRVWKVTAVIATWIETSPWWGDATVRGEAPIPEAGQEGTTLTPLLGDLLTEREFWRVEAGRGAVGVCGGRTAEEQRIGGVFDLVLDWSDGSWRLVGCLD